MQLRSTPRVFAKDFEKSFKVIVRENVSSSGDKLYIHKAGENVFIVFCVLKKPLRVRTKLTFVLASRLKFSTFRNRKIKSHKFSGLYIVQNNFFWNKTDCITRQKRQNACYQFSFENIKHFRPVCIKSNSYFFFQNLL